MSEKLIWSGKPNNGSDDQPTLVFRSVASEIMDLFAGHSPTEQELELLLSRSIKHGRDTACAAEILPTSKKRNTEYQIDVIGTRSSQLRFLSRICGPVFTGVHIKGEDCEPLMIALVDVLSGRFVTSGPEASARVKLVLLEADSGMSLGDNWTPEEFKSKIVTKNGNNRLLSGDVVLDLKEGSGLVGTVGFSHTKAWMKKHEYRIGALAMDDRFATKIKEGFTESFWAKDRRLDYVIPFLLEYSVKYSYRWIFPSEVKTSEVNKKHCPPTLNDEVWRLNVISKDGAFHQRLSDDKVNINTVQDFLKKLNIDPQKLRDILGEGMSAKLWKDVVDHAQTCKLDEKFYVYSSPGSQQKISVVFNVVGQVMGLLSELEYITFEMMSESGKVLSKDLVASAFQQWDRVVSFDNGASPFDKYLKPRIVDYRLKSPITTSSSDTMINWKLGEGSLDLHTKMSIPPKSDELDTFFVDKTMESLNGSKITFSPNCDKLDISQPAVHVDDMAFPFKESPGMGKIIWPPEYPISDTQSFFSQQNHGFDFPQPAFSCNDYGPIIQASHIISPEVNELSFPETVVPSQEIIPTWDSFWDWNWWSQA